MPRSKTVIGLDFDNTLVSYDEVMQQTAVERGLIRQTNPLQDKQQIRDYIRQLPDGELKWQQLQAEVYGKRMSQARLIEGVRDFLTACKNDGIEIYIVSHKTQYAAQDKEKIDLRSVALSWMKQNNFFDAKDFGLSQTNVYFEDTRAEKVIRIKSLGCTHFVDDLKEVFLEDLFPKETVQILFSPGNTSARDVLAKSNESIQTFDTWNDIHHYFFCKP